MKSKKRTYEEAGNEESQPSKKQPSSVTNEKKLQSHDNDVNKAFFEAIYDGDLKFAEYLLKQGAKINQANEDGIAPFYFAFLEGNFEAMQWLLDNGADLNQADAYGETPFDYAATDKNFEAMQWLFEHGANTNNSHGIIPLYVAIINGDLEAMEQILKDGVNVNQVIKDVYQIINGGGTYLHLASTEGDYEAVKLLLKYGAMVNQVNDEGRTPFSIAFFQGNLKIMQCLLAYRADMNQGSYFLGGPLYTAAYNGDLKIIELLLEYKADIDETNYKGRTALHTTSTKVNTRIMEFLLENGADPNVSDNRNNTPFFEAVESRNFKGAKCLLEYGADPNGDNNKYTTPFYNAAFYKDFEMMRFLLENGATPHEDDLQDGEYKNIILSKEMKNKISAIYEYVLNPMFFTDTIVSFNRDSMTHQQIAQFINLIPICYNRLNQLPDEMLNVINDFLGMEELMKLGEHNFEGVFQAMKIPRVMDICLLLSESGLIIKDSTTEESESIYTISSYLIDNNIEEINIHVLQNILPYIQQHQTLITPYLTAMLNGERFPSVASSPQLMQMITATLNLRIDVFIVATNEIESIIPTGEVTRVIKLLYIDGKYYTVTEREEGLIEYNIAEDQAIEEAESENSSSDDSPASSSLQASDVNQHADLNLSDNEVDIEQDYSVQELNQEPSSKLVTPTLHSLYLLLELFKEFGKRIPAMICFINKLITNQEELTDKTMSQGITAIFNNKTEDNNSYEENNSVIESFKSDNIIDVNHYLIGLDNSGVLPNLENGHMIIDFFH